MLETIDESEDRMSHLEMAEYLLNRLEYYQRAVDSGMKLKGDALKEFNFLLHFKGQLDNYSVMVKNTVACWEAMNFIEL